MQEFGPSALVLRQIFALQQVVYIALRAAIFIAVFMRLIVDCRLQVLRCINEECLLLSFGQQQRVSHRRLRRRDLQRRQEPMQLSAKLAEDRNVAGSTRIGRRWAAELLD